ncbi:MAG: LysR family transcriptional regulator [Holosporales bacterium]
MDLDKLRIFYFAAEAKSFTNSELNLSPSAISRHISDLEYRLKVPLFHRTPRGLTLTEQGEVLLMSARRIFAEVDRAIANLDELKDEIQGTLKIATPNGWIAAVIVTTLSEFMKNNPKLRLNITTTLRAPDLLLGDFDIAVHPYIPNQPSLVQNYLASFHLKLFASPEYIAKNGMPKTIEDLDHHQLIAYSDADHPFNTIDWHLTVGTKRGEAREPYLRVAELYTACAQGLGIASLASENVLLRKEELVPVLPDVSGPIIEGYFIYPKHLEDSKRIKVIGDYLFERAKEYRSKE